ncbi:MAG: hypothetical protein RIS35_3538, partial [Pseudomonadota bacterium]
FGAPRQVLVTETALHQPEVGALLSRLASPPILLADPLFHALSSVEHGVGLAFVVVTPVAAIPERVEQDAVYLDRLQDPGNVGTILRTCAAVGVRQVFTAPQTVWCWSPKVLRAGMGAHFHLDIHEAVPWTTLAPTVRARIRATTVVGAVDLYAADLREPSLWMFGREGDGLDPALMADVATRISIPQSPGVESLNVGVAAAVCLYEQFRQRRG